MKLAATTAPTNDRGAWVDGPCGLRWIPEVTATDDESEESAMSLEAGWDLYGEGQ
jgi:hypothetical protein